MINWGFLLTCALAFVSTPPSAGAQDYSVSKDRHSLEDRRPVDPGLLMEASNLLLSGAEGQKELVRRALSGTDGEHWAAAVALVYSGNSKFVRTLMPLIEVEAMNGIAHEMVTRHPKTAWPILVEMAKRGSVNAVGEIARYRSEGNPILDRLTHHESPKVRIRALRAINSVTHFEYALKDNDWHVARAAVSGLLSSRSYDKEKLYFHQTARIRSHAAELTDLWAPVDLKLWARIARDPNAEVRYWAMTRLSMLARADAGRLEAIEAVRLGIINGPANVRQSAVFAVRGWLYSWGDALKTWRVEHVAAARNVFKLRALADELHRQELVEVHERVNSIFVAFPIDAAKALAMVGDKRACALLNKVIRMGTGHAFNEHRTHIGAFAYVRRPEVIESLHEIVYWAMQRPPMPENTGNDYEASVILMAAMETLSKIGTPVDAERFARIARDRELDYRLRDAFLQSLGFIDNPITLQVIIDTAQNETEILSVRYNALLGLALNPSMRALEAAIGMKNHPDKGMAMNAGIAEEQWHRRFGGNPAP